MTLRVFEIENNIIVLHFTGALFTILMVALAVFVIRAAWRLARIV